MGKVGDGRRARRRKQAAVGEEGGGADGAEGCGLACFGVCGVGWLVGWLVGRGAVACC
jgi:hypothetical protein